MSAKHRPELPPRQQSPPPLRSPPPPEPAKQKHRRKSVPARESPNASEGEEQQPAKPPRKPARPEKSPPATPETGSAKASPPPEQPAQSRLTRSGRPTAELVSLIVSSVINVQACVAKRCFFDLAAGKHGNRDFLAQIFAASKPYPCKRAPTSACCSKGLDAVDKHLLRSITGISQSGGAASQLLGQGCFPNYN